MAYTIFDLECDGLLDEVTKLHCFCYQIYEKGVLLEKGALVNPNDIITFLDKQETLIGHNIIRFDLPVLKKLLGWKKPKELKIIDTMGLSWYLYIGRKSHGLESFGEEFGVPKPKISDWSNLTIEEYIHRCSEDVEINQRLFHKQIPFLHKLYPKQEDKERIINYLNFKLDCLREQEEVKIKVDTKLLYKSLDELETIYNEKVEILKGIMPKVYKYKEVTKPNKMTKKDGSLSEAGKKWLALLQEQELPEDYEGIVTLICGEEEPNPGSVDQVKKWFYSLCWIPCTYKTVKDKKKGTKKEVEQIYDDNGKICNSVKKLIEIVPEIELFNDLSLITHRIGVFKSFMESMDKNNCVYATAGGLSNTFRFLHRKPISNLPKPNTFYGKEIRGLILSPKENTILCGSDLSAAEDTTKQNYMYKFDPEYVTKMRVPGFDPHIEVAVFVNLMTREQANKFKELDSKENKTDEEKKEFSTLKSIRGKAKTVNFASVYKVGAPTLAKNLDCTKEEAETILDGYWTMNKSVLDVEKDLLLKVIHKTGEIKVYKTTDFLPKDNSKKEKKRCQKLQNSFLQTVDTMYILNPVSNFWISLRYFKDIFSSLNQSTAVFVFDCYLQEVRKRVNTVMLQIHDEYLCYFNKNISKDSILKYLKECISRVNDKIKFPIPMDISADFGVNYAECH